MIASRQTCQMLASTQNETSVAAALAHKPAITAAGAVFANDDDALRPNQIASASKATPGAPSSSQT